MRNIYIRKRRWKIFLFIAALAIVIMSLLYIDNLAKQIEKEQRIKIKLWADAINKKAQLVNITDKFYTILQDEERKKVRQWANAYLFALSAPQSADLTFYLDIISDNNTIPVILTDNKKNIQICANVDFNKDSVKVLSGDLLKEFEVFKPIEISYIGNEHFFLYYKDSKIFTGLKEVLDKQVTAFLSDIVNNAPSVPVIITNAAKDKIIASGNIDSAKINTPENIKQTISAMEADNNIIQIDLPGSEDCMVFYKDSALLVRLKYFPYIQFLIIGVFLFIAYLLFSTSRRSEQNQVWVGMARETAHQLGTPLSSLIAWVELLQLKGVGEETLSEVRKDIKRLETITERFSKIGSDPKLESNNVVEVVAGAIEYLKKRTSKKIQYILHQSSDEITVKLNRYLFEWVIENLCKNAIDAMSGAGTIQININEEPDLVSIDISDTGKGIAKSKYKAIFNPGFTSKKTGWGLGLSLSERIIENYHAGKIFVKSSIIGKGTTFRILLKK